LGKSENSGAVTVEQAEARVRVAKQELSDAQHELRVLRGQSAATRKQPRPCGCGCEVTTGGGTFVPGHDAKLRSRLLRALRGTDEGTTPESEAAALAELRGWPKLAHNVGDWDLGRDRKERERKAAQKAHLDVMTAESDAAKTAGKEAAANMQARSRAEVNAAADERIRLKEAAIELQKAIDAKK
jgi:hypothetical protein